MSLENEFEQVNSGAQEAVSPEPQSSEPVVSQDDSQSVSSAKETKQPEPNVPFHEHPRFKELVEQKNKYAEQLKAFEDRYKQLEERLSRPQAQEPKQDPLIARLRDIDPEFAERIEKLSGLSEKASEYERKLAEIEERAFARTALEKINTLHATNKVPKELQERYNKELDIAYQSGQLRDVNAVEAKYKQIHEDYSKLLESYKRTAIEQYTSAKKADAKAPASQPKGQSVNHSKKFEWSKDPEEARRQLVSRVLNTAKAEKEI